MEQIVDAIGSFGKTFEPTMELQFMAPSEFKNNSRVPILAQKWKVKGGFEFEWRPVPLSEQMRQLNPKYPQYLLSK